MGFFTNAPYSLRNLVRGAFMAQADGRPLSAYKYAVALQEEEDARFGRTRALAQDSTIRTLGSAALHNVAHRAVAQYYTQQGRDTQYEDENFSVKVKSGYHRDSRQAVTDVLVFDRKRNDGGHWHIIIDTKGTILHQSWRQN